MAARRRRRRCFPRRDISTAPKPKAFAVGAFAACLRQLLMVPDKNFLWALNTIQKSKPALAHELVEHLTVDHCSNQMVPGSIPGGRMHLRSVARAAKRSAALALRSGTNQ